MRLLEGVVSHRETTMRNPITIALFLSIFLQMTECLCMADPVSSDNASIHQKIYQFQHRLLPKWTHQSKGAFLDDLMQGNTGRFTEAATKIVGEEFSQKIQIRKYPEAKGVLLVFQPPNEPPECFFIYIFKAKDGFRFFTYEKSADIFGEGDKGVVGEWSADGTHLNMGSRKYDDIDSFVTELQVPQ